MGLHLVSAGDPSQLVSCHRKNPLQTGNRWEGPLNIGVDEQRIKNVLQVDDAATAIHQICVARGSTRHYRGPDKGHFAVQEH